jgi:hypothetical protein
MVSFLTSLGALPRKFLMALLLLPLFMCIAKADSVTFYAHPASTFPASPSHAWVCVSRTLRQAVKDECWGFYPQSARGAFSDQPGIVKRELSTDDATWRFNRASRSLRAEVSEAQLRAFFQALRDWERQNTYNLIVNNCGDLIFRLAAAIGLNVPPRPTAPTPMKFLENLQRQNPS